MSANLPHSINAANCTFYLVIIRSCVFLSNNAVLLIHLIPPYCVYSRESFSHGAQHPRAVWMGKWARTGQPLQSIPWIALSPWDPASIRDPGRPIRLLTWIFHKKILKWQRLKQPLSPLHTERFYEALHFRGRKIWRHNDPFFLTPWIFALSLTWKELHSHLQRLRIISW